MTSLHVINLRPSNSLCQSINVAGASGGTTTAGGGGVVTAVRVAEGDSIFPASRVATIRLLCESRRSRYHGGVGSVTTLPSSTPESAWPIPQLPLNAICRHGNQSGEQSDYSQDVYVYHLVNAATALANSAGRKVGAHNPVQDITVGFGLDRLRMTVYCKEAPGSVDCTDTAAEDEGDLDSLRF